MLGQERYPILSEEVEEWIDAIVDDLMERYERAGTPIKGGFPIANSLRLAYLTGSRSKKNRELLEAMKKAAES